MAIILIHLMMVYGIFFVEGNSVVSYDNGVIYESASSLNTCHSRSSTYGFYWVQMDFPRRSDVIP